MILQSLNAYYLRLENDPNIDIAPFGFSRQQMSYCVVLNTDGSLHEIEDIRALNDKGRVSRPLLVPGNAKPSGAGIHPGFLWDNPAYVLGYKKEDTTPKRTLASFHAFRKRHLGAEASIADSAFSAVCRFLENWNPVEAENHAILRDISTGFGVFRLRGDKSFVHARPHVQVWWRSQIEGRQKDADVTIGQCLVTGDVGPVARLHEPKIKGVWGAQSSGAAIVSFNLNAFESYGKLQSLNSPVGERAAFRYCTALNNLLEGGIRQRIQIGDASTVFWTEKATEAETLLPWVFEPTGEAEDESLKNKLRAVLAQIAAGSYPSDFGASDTPFYVLGLSPNAARIAVRFWWTSTLGRLVENLHQHFVDLQIVRSDRDPEFPSVRQLIRETAREPKDIPPLLSGSVMRSVLTGAPYPSMLFSSTMRRIRADRQVWYLSASMIKAHINRNSRFGIEPLDKEIGMSLDTERPEPPYHLGRLFAELEKAQEDALPGIKDTIKDRYFGAASATPGNVFPRLIRLSQHHLGRLERGSRTYREKRIQEIAGRLAEFPAHLSLRDQGLFAIGYYHQRQAIFTKRCDDATAAAERK